MPVEDGWVLPDLNPTLQLTFDELRLVDWIICGASRLMAEADTGYLVTVWEPLRLKLWEAIDVADSPCEHPVYIPYTEAQALFAICPTTFQWGVGQDVGLSLKVKLARLLAPEMFHEHDHDQTEAQGAAAAPGAAGDEAGF